MDHPIVSEIFFYGDSLNNFAIAIISPNKDNLISFAKNKGIKTDDYEKICQDLTIRKELCK